MEGNSIGCSCDRIQRAKHIENLAETPPVQKSLVKQKIKAMHHRIFWRRNNSQSSLEKIKKKQTLPTLDKLQQIKRKNLNVQNHIEQLTKKLSLPKIRDSSSFHCQKLRQCPSQNTHLLKQNSWLVKNYNISKIEKKQKINKQNQVLIKYNKRCKEEIQQFSLIPTTRLNQSFISEIQQQNKKQKESKISKWMGEGGFIPMQMVSYLTKYNR